MSTCTDHAMTNHHGISGLWMQFAGLVTTWRQRHQQRVELCRLSERDIHDIGLSWPEVMEEAEKPFWRA